MQAQPHVAYLYSRYPVVSQTFCDTEMLALEERGFRITVGSLNPPTTSFRHERLDRLQAEIIYPPPSAVMEARDEADPVWLAMVTLAEQHEKLYGPSFKSATRARNAYFFAREFIKRGIRHVHVHFANRATHTALFLKKAGLTFSFTAHAQDFMIDLGSRELLQEMACEAEFVIAVSDFSKGLLQEMCPDSVAKIRRIYNGLDPAAFTPTRLSPGPLQVLSIGRLIDFKGFQHLIPAMALLRERGVDSSLKIVGEGPLRSALESQIASLNASAFVQLLGIQSQDQIKQLMEQSHVFALGCVVDSKGASDILPTVILEAMAAGRPVVSTRLVGVPEMVEHGVSGLLAEPGDEVALADHLQALAQDPALRETLGAASRAKFEATFALEHTAGQLAEAFRDLGQPGPSASASPLLCLLPQWPMLDAAAVREISFLLPHPSVRLLAPNCIGKLDAPADGVQFLPDAIVLESAWRNAPALVAKVEALYEKCGPVDGEMFFREARRAVYLAGQLVNWGITQVHAFRSETMLCAWLLHKLTGVTVTATIQSRSSLSRQSLEIMAKEFAAGSCSDAKVKSTWPDALLLGEPPAKSGLFKRPAASPVADVASVWQRWLKMLPSV